MKKISLLTLGMVAMATVAMANDAQRTSTYNTVMQNNIAADFTIADYMVRPYLIGDLQFISGNYGGSLNSTEAAFSFNAMGLNMFAFADNHSNPASGTETGVSSSIQRAYVGAGTGSFGGGLMFEANSHTNVASNDDQVKTHYDGHGIGLFASFGTGNLGFYGSAKFEDLGNHVITTPASGDETTAKNTGIAIQLGGIKDTEGEGSHAIGAVLNVMLGSQETKTGSSDPTVDNSTLDLGLILSHGIPLVYNDDDFAAFCGLDLGFDFNTYSNNMDGTEEAESGIGIWARPNMAFQKTLGKGFETSLGTSMDFFHFMTGTETDQAGNETKMTWFDTHSAALDLGLRWVYENFAIDGTLSKGLVQSGPNFISGGTNDMFGSVGLSLSY